MMAKPINSPNWLSVQKVTLVILPPLSAIDLLSGIGLEKLQFTTQICLISNYMHLFIYFWITFLKQRSIIFVICMLIRVQMLISKNKKWRSFWLFLFSGECWNSWVKESLPIQKAQKYISRWVILFFVRKQVP